MQSPLVDGDRLWVRVAIGHEPRFYRLRQQTTGASVIASSPAAGESGVAVTRETILRLSAPLAADVSIDGQRLYAEFGGRRLLARPELSGDRQTLRLFYLEDLPASAVVRVSMDGNGLSDFSGALLDADGDGVAGGVYVTTFSTLGNTALPGTGVIGTVFDSERNPDGSNRPLAGVTITVDGAEQTLRAVTDANGSFLLLPAPAGRFFVHIDGRTAASSQWPDGAYYPLVGKAWEALPGMTNNLAGGTGEIFLPRIGSQTLQVVSSTSDTSIGFPASVVEANPALADVAITVPANALFADDGTRGGKVGIAPVPPDRLPGPLPPGLEMPLVITVQTDGPLNFDRPAPICFPNVPDPVTGLPLPPNSRQSLISFNHDKGEWEAAGTMTVSADGRLICSDPGSGIRQPGWHGVGPPPVGPPPPGPCSGGGPSGGGATASTAVLFSEVQLHNSSEGDCLPCQEDPELLQRCFEVVEEAYKKCTALSKAILKQDLKNCRATGDTSLQGECISGALQRAQEREDKCAENLRIGTKACSICFGNAPLSLRSVSAPVRRARSLSGVPGLAADDPDVAITALVQQAADPATVLPQVDPLLAQADALAGGDFAAFYQERALDAELRANAQTPSQIANGNAPDHPVLYAAEVLRPGGLLHLRGRTLPGGQYSLFVPRDGILVDVSFYDPESKRFAAIQPNLSPDADFALPRFTLAPLIGDEADADGDGLPDRVEEVLGTDPKRPDSDGDGIRDGVEIEQGTNPLDGLPMQQGVIASVRTLGVAVDVCAFDDFAVVAEGAAGVSVFDASNFFNPVRVAQVDTPGDARAVACAGNLVAVADGGAGLAVIDITDRATSFIARQVALPGNAVAVSATGGLAYTGLENGIIAVVEMSSGRLLSTLSLGSTGLQDILAMGDAVYALVPPKLFTLSFEGSALAVTSQADASSVPQFHSRRLRLNAGQGLLYAATVNGFQVFSLADPFKPVLLRANTTPQSGWRQLVPNGSGFGVGVAGVNSNGDGTDDVYLHDLKPGETNSTFVTLLPTPGLAGALSIFNGLAYVADGSAGLLVLNYLAADTASVPPTITLGASFPLSPLAQAESGARVGLAATTGDDVQVRNVEFYVDGNWIGTDGNYPFEASFTTPLLTATKANFTIRARATDTGGSSTWTPETLVALVPDATQPRVRRISPAVGAKAVDLVTVYFSEPIRPASFNPATVQILSAGADGNFETADDGLVSAASFPVDAETFAAGIRFAAPLPDGRYRLTLGTGITDLNNNPLAFPVVHEFRVADVTFWTGGADNVWTNPLNWSTGQVPGASDRVFIGGGSLRLTTSVSVRSLESFADHEIANTTLQAAEGIVLHRSVLLNRGILRQSTLTLLDGAIIRVNNQSWSELDDMTITGDVDLGTGIFAGQLSLRNRVTLMGRLRNASTFAALQAEGNATFAGGLIELNTSLNVTAGSVFTLAADAILSGPGFVAGPGAFINEGTLRMGARGYAGIGSTLNVAPALFTHRGSAEMTDGGELVFGGKWGGEGTVNVINGRFAMAGEFGLPLPRITKAAAGTVELRSVVNLQGGTVTLNSTTGGWRLNGGGFRNGALTLLDGVRLLCSPNGSDVLEAMTVNGLVETEAFGILNVRGGLTLNGTLRLRSGSAQFEGEQTIMGGLLDVLSGGLNLPAGAKLTLSDTTMVNGFGGGFSGVGTLVNLGQIVASQANFAITPGMFDNQGTVQVIGGTALSLGGAITGTGPIEVTSGLLSLRGSFPAGQPVIRKAAAGRVHISGLIDLNGGTLALNATTGGWVLNNGGFRNGTITLTDGVRLGAYFNQNTLDHLTINGAIDLAGEQNFGVLTIRNGLTMNGSLNVTGDARVTFDGTQTFAGSAFVLSAPGRMIVPAASTLTLATDALVRGSGTIEGTGAVVNRGKISADAAGGTLRVTVATFTNEGTLEAINGGTLIAPGFP